MAKTFIQRSRETSSSEKATYHHVTGAGRSRVKRPFFDLNSDDETAIVRQVEQALEKRLQAER